MLKNWKSLFVKTEDDDPAENGGTAQQKKATEQSDTFAFPVQNGPQPVAAAQTAMATGSNKALEEVLKVYEQGLDSINMPGYDFFEFYKAVSAAGQPNSQIYNMAFQMASTMDKTVTVHKLTSDAEFYISKINEVHGQYGSQGLQKINAITTAKSSEKSKLAAAVEQANMRIAQLRVELQSLEKEVHQNRDALAKVDASYAEQEQSVRLTMSANDQARQQSIAKLNAVKDGINNFITQK
ncbi:MAG: hypothetical protein EAY75_05320 [Bacteroidetes bacterium]|nr:MAG: hypothetical protein EAY75_05320 [Bacteroidota bacterium]